MVDVLYIPCTNNLKIYLYDIFDDLLARIAKKCEFFQALSKTSDVTNFMF